MVRIPENVFPGRPLRGWGEAEAQAGAFAARQAAASRLGGDRAGALCQHLPGTGGERGAVTLGAGGGRDYPFLVCQPGCMCWGFVQGGDWAGARDGPRLG